MALVRNNKAPQYMVFATVVLGLLGIVAYALPEPSATQMTNHPAVVAIEGHVLHTQSRWIEHSKLITTDVTLSVDRASHEGMPTELTFVAPGGELVERNMRMTINAVPMFRQGQRVVVSLDTPDLGNADQPLYRYRTHLPTPTVMAAL